MCCVSNVLNSLLENTQDMFPHVKSNVKRTCILEFTHKMCLCLIINSTILATPGAHSAGLPLESIIILGNYQEYKQQ